MKKPMAVMLLILALVFGGVFGWNAFVGLMTERYLANYQPPALSVEVESARAEQWDSVVRAVGTLSAVNGVDITTEVGGLIREIYFASGQQVEEGQVLIQLDDRVEQATLGSFLAQLKLARINFERDQRLLSSKAISRTDFDTSEASLSDMQAQVDRTQALIEQKQIRAPFHGRLGIRLVNVGEYVNSGDQLVTLQALDYLNVDFRVPEYYVPQLYFGQEVRFRVKAHGERLFTARVSAIDAKVDEDTRSIRVRASFANEKKDLMPGMFADLEVVLATDQPVITLPETAINLSLYGDSVYVVTERAGPEGRPEQVVERRYVKVGDRQGERLVIREGVAVGELVVISGQLKLNDGARVQIAGAH